MPTLPSLRSKVWVGAGLGLGLGLREGRVGTSPETWIDPKPRGRDEREHYTEQSIFSGADANCVAELELVSILAESCPT